MKNVCLTVRGPVIAQKGLSEIDDSLQLLSCNHFCPFLDVWNKSENGEKKIFPAQ